MAAESKTKDQEGTKPEDGHKDGLEGSQKPAEGQKEPEGGETGSEAEKGTEGQESFPRAVVEKLRSENADLRVKAKRAEELSSRLLAATVKEATKGILADPTDLPVSSDLYDEDGWPDPERIAEAAKALVERKPHLADRRPGGPVEQGPREGSKDVNLAGILRSLAG